MIQKNVNVNLLPYSLFILMHIKYLKTAKTGEKIIK